MKKAIGIILVLAMLISVFPAVVSADASLISGELTFNDGRGTECSVEFDYNDDYFCGSAYDLTAKLAEVSIYLTAASFNAVRTDTSDYGDCDRDLRSFLTACGFTAFESNDDFTSKPQDNTVGVGIASKATVIGGENCTLVAVGIRGGDYEAEWAGNAYVGDSGDHAGFSLCADETMRFLTDYLSRHTEIQGRIKLWMSGMSRGGAAANLAGARIDDMLAGGKALAPNVKLSPDDLYVYTFETPMAADAAKCNSAIYNNIHNIINPNDIVVRLFPAGMGFARYGLDHRIPIETDDGYKALYNAAIAEYRSICAAYTESELNQRISAFSRFTYMNVHPGAVLEILSGRSSSMSRSEYLERFADITATLIGSRAKLAGYQDDAMEVMRSVFGSNSEQYRAAMQDLADNTVRNLTKLMLSALNPFDDFLTVQLENIVLTALRDAGIGNYDAVQVNSMIADIIPIMTQAAALYPDELATFLNNSATLLTVHDVPYMMAWLRTLPAEYLESQEPAYSGGLPFTDIPADFWCYDDIKYVLRNGMMQGKASDLFAPYGLVTRGQAVTVLYRMQGSPDVSRMGAPLKDADGAWCRDALVWAYNSGVSLGYLNGNSGYNDSLTREQLAAMLYRYASIFCGAQSTAEIPSRFTDKASVSEYAVTAMAWCIEKGIINGTSETALTPQANANRAQFAAMVTRFDKLIG